MSPIRKTALVIALTLIGASQAGCMAAAVGIVAGTAIGVTGKAVGMTAKGAGKVVGAAIPGGGKKDQKR